MDVKITDCVLCNIKVSMQMAYNMAQLSWYASSKPYVRWLVKDACLVNGAVLCTLYMVCFQENMWSGIIKVGCLVGNVSYQIMYNRCAPKGALVPFIRYFVFNDRPKYSLFVSRIAFKYLYVHSPETQSFYVQQLKRFYAKLINW